MDCNKIFRNIYEWFKSWYFVEEECKVCGRKNK